MSVTNKVSETDSAWWQWSLKELIVVITFMAVFLAMMAYMGTGNQLFWVCSVGSLIIMVACLIGLPLGNRAVPCVITFVVMFLLCNPILMFFSLVMAINGLLHVVLLWRAAAMGERMSFKQVLLRSSCLTLIAFSIGICFGLEGYAQLSRYKAETQLTDLTDRLSYEGNADSGSIDLAHMDGEHREVTQKNAPLGFSFKAEEDNFSRGMYRGRASALKGLHNGWVEQFVKSPGFGVGRFGGATVSHLHYARPQNIGFELMSAERVDELHEDTHGMFYQASVRIEDERSFHWEAVRDFVDPDANGFIVEPRLAFGFLSHRFSMPIQNLGQNFLASSSLKMSKLHLVSMLRFEKPRAYALEHLPRMDQLSGKDVATRELTPFENESIEHLMQSTKLVRFRENADGLEMVGAIRAYQSCLECHNVSRGDMLGAFTYQFETDFVPQHKSSTAPLD